MTRFLAKTSRMVLLLVVFAAGFGRVGYAAAQERAPHPADHALHDARDGCRFERMVGHGIRFHCPDGSTGHVAPTAADHVFVVIRDPAGTVESLSLERRSDGKIVENRELFLPKGCRSARDDCRLRMYLGSLDPGEEPAEWANRLSALPSCPEPDGGEPIEYCQPPSDYDPCPLYEDVCGWGIPFVSKIACGIRVACELGVREW